jgi:hypothetical protein
MRVFGQCFRDAPDQMLEHQRHLLSRWRLALPQEHHDRLAAGHVIDVDRQEAAGVVVGVEQRQLLPAVNRVAGVVDVQRDRGRLLREALAEQIHHHRRHPRRSHPRGHVLEPAHGRLRAQRRAALWQPARRQLEQRVIAQRITVIGILMAAGNGHHAEQQHLLNRVADPAGIAPVLHAGRQHARQAQPPVRLPQEQQAAIGGNRTAIEARGHLLAGNGWKIEGKKAIVAHGGCCLVASAAGNRLDNEFLHQINELRYIRQPTIIALMNNPGYALFAGRLRFLPRETVRRHVSETSIL